MRGFDLVKKAAAYIIASVTVILALGFTAGVPFEDAEKERREWNSKHIFEEPFTPVMKGYVKE